MKITFAESGQPLDPREIAAFEAGAQIRFPPEYRAFLLRQNGGAPPYMVGLRSGFDSDFQLFFQLYRRGRADDFPDLAGNITPRIIWFGCDSGGGLFGIVHAGAGFGRVVWYDLPHSPTDPLSPDECTPVAESFNAFLDDLAPLDDLP